MFAVIHPRAVTLHRQRPDGTPRNVWRGRVGEVDREGTRVRVLIEASPPIVAEITPAALAELGLEPGTEVWIIRQGDRGDHLSCVSSGLDGGPRSGLP